jgi:hypothetical protein
MIGHAFEILDGKGRKISETLKINQELSFADICGAGFNGRFTGIPRDKILIMAICR